MTGFLTPTHMLLLLTVLLIVFGSKRLPELGRSLGSGMREFRHSLSGQGQLQEPSDDPPAAPPADQSATPPA
jgi:sec-independent protein translocase protein TatA